MGLLVANAWHRMSTFGTLLCLFCHKNDVFIADIIGDLLKNCDIHKFHGITPNRHSLPYFVLQLIKLRDGYDKALVMWINQPLVTCISQLKV